MVACGVITCNYQSQQTLDMTKHQALGVLTATQLAWDSAVPEGLWHLML